jgi:hypothetical protein
MYSRTHSSLSDREAVVWLTLDRLRLVWEMNQEQRASRSAHHKGL